MSCGFPQRAFGEEIHGDGKSGECIEGIRDIMKGICWSIYRDESLKRKWFEKLGLNEMNEKEFKKWMTRIDGSGEMVNGCRMCLEVWRELE